jgi:MSHA biogenesis protein MshP
MRPILHRTEQGFAAIAAIFLVVVLAALGGFMLTFSNTQQLTSAQDMQGTKAYWAARAGLDWGIGSIVASSTVPPACPPEPNATPATSTTILATAFDGGFTVTVSCSRASFLEGSAVANRFIYTFTSVAKSAANIGTIGFVERSLTATMER